MAEREEIHRSNTGSPAPGGLRSMGAQGRYLSTCRHPNDAHLGLVGEEATVGSPGEEKRARMYVFRKIPAGSWKWTGVGVGADWHPAGRKSVGQCPTMTQIITKVQPFV